MRTVKKPKEEVKSRGTLRTEDFLLYPGDLDSKSVIFRSYSRKITQAVLDTVVPSRKGRDAGEQFNNLLCTSIASSHSNPAPPSLGNSAPPSCGDPVPYVLSQIDPTAMGCMSIAKGWTHNSG